MSQTPELETLPLDLRAILDDKVERDPTQRIYANRNLNMSKVDVIGFDMDYTLAQYHQRAMDELSVRVTIHKLVQDHGYPDEIHNVHLDYDFMIRGLVVDKETGNIFKMDAHRHVGRCYHGYQAVDDAVRRSLYGSKPIALSSKRFARVDTLFSLPETTLMAGIIDHWARLELPLPWTYHQLFSDIRASIDEAHRDNTLKQEILANLETYIVKAPDLGPALHKLRSAGKRLFLLTNSEWYYTDAVMGFLLDGSVPHYKAWRSFFDCVMVKAQKPRFFNERVPFDALGKDGTMHGEATTLVSGGIYRGGNIRSFEEMFGVDGEAVLYVGDHMYSDIVKSKKAGIWRTLLVVQEMDRTIRLTHELKDKLTRIRNLEIAARTLDDGINYHQTLLLSLGRVQDFTGRMTGPEAAVIQAAQQRAREQLARKRALLRQTLEELNQLEAAVDARFNPYWGRVFREGNERSMFGGQVEDYADIYTSKVSNLLGYSPGQYFRAPREVMPHEPD